MVFMALPFSHFIIHDSLMIIPNHVSIHINIQVFRNIFYSCVTRMIR